MDNASDNTASCKHGTCECPALLPSGYCSLYCENVDHTDTLPGYGELSGACACGHDGCSQMPETVNPSTAPISVGTGNP